MSKVKLNYTGKFHFRRPQSLRDANLYRNTSWEKRKNVQFCKILNTLQLLTSLFRCVYTKLFVTNLYHKWSPEVNFVLIRLATHRRYIQSHEISGQR